MKDLEVVLYSRRGCHLCETAWLCLRTEQRRFLFSMRSVDVDGDPDLTVKYGDWVPVVTVNGKLRFRGGINRVLLVRLLHAEIAGRGAKKPSQMPAVPDP